MWIQGRRRRMHKINFDLSKWRNSHDLLNTVFLQIPKIDQMKFIGLTTSNSGFHDNDLISEDFSSTKVQFRRHWVPSIEWVSRIDIESTLTMLRTNPILLSTLDLASPEEMAVEQSATLDYIYALTFTYAVQHGLEIQFAAWANYTSL